MPIPVFLNGTPFSAELGDTLGTLVESAAPDLSPAMRDGTAIATDGRGIAVDATAPLYPGAIFMVRRSARAARDLEA